jgi:hypothetical protein
LKPFYTLLIGALDIWLAFKRTTLNFYEFCMAARTVTSFAQPSVLLLCMAARKEPILFFEQGIYKSIIRGSEQRDFYERQYTNSDHPAQAVPPLRRSAQYRTRPATIGEMPGGRAGRNLFSGIFPFHGRT